MKTTTKAVLAVSALSVPIGAFISTNGILMIAGAQIKYAPITVVVTASALPIAMSASTLAIKYQDKKYLLLTAISVIGFLQALRNKDINPPHNP